MNKETVMRTPVVSDKSKTVRAGGACATCRTFFRRSYSVKLFTDGSILYVPEAFKQYYIATRSYCSMGCLSPPSLLVLRETGYVPSIRENPVFLKVTADSWEKVYAITGWNFEVDMPVVENLIAKVIPGKIASLPPQVEPMVQAIIREKGLEMTTLIVQGVLLLGFKEDVEKVKNNLDEAISRLKDSGALSDDEPNGG